MEKGWITSKKPCWVPRIKKIDITIIFFAKPNGIPPLVCIFVN